MNVYQQFHDLANGLNAAQVRYLVVGGMAVIAHGYTRLTKDIDVLLDLDDQANVERAMATITALGYHPRIPVPLAAFADPALRRQWHDERNMLAFSVYNSGHGHVEMDLFIVSPFPFTPAWDQRALRDIGDGVMVPFVDLARLLQMKREAGRPKDQEDVRVLTALGAPLAGA